MRYRKLHPLWPDPSMPFLSSYASPHGFSRADDLDPALHSVFFSCFEFFSLCILNLFEIHFLTAKCLFGHPAWSPQPSVAFHSFFTGQKLPWKISSEFAGMLRYDFPAESFAFQLWASLHVVTRGFLETSWSWTFSNVSIQSWGWRQT